ncbi:MAG: peptide chain release factor N(5)-glutamine methyltransferase [Bacteroidales bacterium]
MKNTESQNITEFFRDIRLKLEEAYDSREARSLALILMEYIAGIDMKGMIIEPDAYLDEVETEQIMLAVERLLKHEPVQYIIGLAYFAGNEFEVTPDVLIPRPETEELVRWILEDHSGSDNLCIADVGTGSGCIAVSLSLRMPDAEIDAFDNSEAALELAAKNNEELGGGVRFLKLDIMDETTWVQKSYDVIVSNPPYIPEQNKKDLPANVAGYEPESALFVPGDDALLFYRALSGFAKTHLNSSGSTYVEVHEELAAEVVQLFEDQGFSQVILRSDINDKPRMVKAVL